MDDDLLEALRTDVVEWLRTPGNYKPEVCSTGQASLILESWSGQTKAHRPWRAEWADVGSDLKGLALGEAGHAPS